jgi:hypothetical protein
MKHKLYLICAFVLAFAVSGCATVEPWERDYLALEPMAVDGAACQRFEHNIEVYREGTVGANGGKSGGGCGCT